MPACRALGIGVIPFFPLAAGLLTGKYKRGEPVPPGTRFDLNKALQVNLTDEKFDKVDRLTELAHQFGRPVSQLAITWLLARPEVSTVITGATRPEQVDENAAATTWVLDEATLAEIDRILG